MVYILVVYIQVTTLWRRLCGVPAYVALYSQKPFLTTNGAAVLLVNLWRMARVSFRRARLVLARSPTRNTDRKNKYERGILSNSSFQLSAACQ